MTGVDGDGESDGLRVCLLPEAAQAARGADLAEAFYARVEAARELEDGYALELPAERDLAHLVVDELWEERVCCPGFDLSLRFARGQGAMTVAFRGSAALKAALRRSLERMGVLPGAGGAAGGEAAAPRGDAPGCGCGCGAE